jgi:hypothetical protein
VGWVWGGLVEEVPVVEESGAEQLREAPVIGPPQPREGDLDCADFERRSFPIDPDNDPHALDADNDGLACELPPAD